MATSTSTRQQAGNLKPPHIVVLGAGAIGCYIGAWLNTTEAQITFLGRPSVEDRVRQHGLTVSDLNQRSMSFDASEINFETSPAVLMAADLILVTVKSADTPEAAKQILQHAKTSALILSFQNGVGNAKVLQQQLPDMTVIGGMVPFNVATLPEGRLHCATEGQLCAEEHPSLTAWLPLFKACGLPIQLHQQFEAIQWGKLILNLNNSVNALSGLPLKAQLSDRAYRQSLALLIEETLHILKLAGIQPAKISKAPPSLLPVLLRAPNFIFKRLAAGMLKIDESARSSMWEDLQMQRKTEVDYINGAVINLAHSLGQTAAINSRMVALIKSAEAGEYRPQDGRHLLSDLMHPQTSH
jgi:2-dehydropantoate 2-reductase